MVDDYELFFNEEPLNIREVTGLPPASCLHPLKNTSISLQYNFTGAVLHRQRFVLKQFQMELLQLDSGEAFRFGCRPLKDRLFILFCLDGEIRFTTGQGRQITAARKGYFYISRGMRAATMQIVLDREQTLCFSFRFLQLGQKEKLNPISD